MLIVIERESIERKAREGGRKERQGTSERTESIKSIQRTVPIDCSNGLFQWTGAK
jgi:hypothetical protein